MPSHKILLIDGYNVINRVQELQPSLDSGLENARNALATLVSRWGRERPGVECVIVFDGDHRFAGSRSQRLSGIKSIFSVSRHGGDEEIIRFVREFKGRPSDITVVSDDNHVRNNARALGAAIQPTSFFAIRKARRPAARASAPAEGKGLDNRAAAEINRELRKKFGI